MTYAIAVFLSGLFGVVTLAYGYLSTKALRGHMTRPDAAGTYITFLAAAGVTTAFVFLAWLAA